MKAIMFHKHGTIDVLKYTDFPTPEPGDGEVLIKLEAAALNRVDVSVRNGWQGLKMDFPHIPGADGAGEITALGTGVEGWEAGDRVVINANIADLTCEYCIAGLENQCRNWDLLGETLRGTYAEYISVPSENIMRIPKGFDPATAAASALVFHTSWHSLIDRGKLRPGETVLVVGASGGVNTASIQVAKLAGATVYTVGSNAKKLALAEEMGADYLIDRSKEENWSKTVFTQTKKRGVDVVVDNVATTFPQSLRAVRKGGRILTVGTTGGAHTEIDNRYIFGKHISILGSTMGTRKNFADVMNLIFAGKLNPAMDKSFLLKDAAKAQARLESGEQLGKITLEIG